MRFIATSVPAANLHWVGCLLCNQERAASTTEAWSARAIDNAHKGSIKRNRPDWASGSAVSKRHELGALNHTNETLRLQSNFEDHTPFGIIHDRCILVATMNHPQPHSHAKCLAAHNSVPYIPHCGAGYDSPHQTSNEAALSSSLNSSSLGAIKSFRIQWLPYCVAKHWTREPEPCSPLRKTLTEGHGSRQYIEIETNPGATKTAP